MIHLIINLIFLTSFQFINLSNLALWVNNRHKWITIIFLNLCDNFLLYDLFCLLSLVFAFIYLFIFAFIYLCLYYDTHPILLPTLWIYSAFCTSNKKLFLTFTIFFLSLVPIIAQLPVNKEQTVKHYTNIFSNLYKLYSLSLSLSLSLLSI